jgi:hypothetical protein
MSEIDVRDDRGVTAPGVTPGADLRDDERVMLGSDTSSVERTDDEKKADAELANRLAALIEDANSRVVPLCKMIRKVSAVPKYV